MQFATDSSVGLLKLKYGFNSVTLGVDRISNFIRTWSWQHMLIAILKNTKGER